MKKMIINDNYENAIPFDLFSQRLYYDDSAEGVVRSDLNIEVKASEASINDFAPYMGIKIESIVLLDDNGVEYERFNDYSELEYVFRSSENSTNTFNLQFK